MKIIITTLILAFLILFDCYAEKALNLSGVTQIRFWDLKISDLNEQEKIITSPESVEAIINILTSEKPNWNKVLTTAATGDIRLIFYVNGDLIEAIGVGDGFVVRGTGGNGQVAKINKQFEAKLRESVQTSLKNTSNQRTHSITASGGSE